MMWGIFVICGLFLFYGWVEAMNRRPIWFTNAGILWRGFRNYYRSRRRQR